jgi:hypothetical protein
MKVSICIPTYDKNGENIEFIKECINSCLFQDYDDFEIIISDHSKSETVKNFIVGYKNDKIKYFKNLNNVGSPAYNTNNAIENSQGDLIKIMNQDDFFLKSNTLSNMVNLCHKNSWVTSPFTHLNQKTGQFFNNMISKINGDGTHLLNAVNTVGCPSVGIFPKGIVFDTNITYMIDCELWYQLFLKYGHPKNTDEIGIVIRVGNHSLTSQWESESVNMIENEKNYCKTKYQL